MSRVWTSEMDETAKRMWVAGYTARAIAKALETVSRNAVIGRLYRVLPHAIRMPVRQAKYKPRSRRKAKAPVRAQVQPSEGAAAIPSAPPPKSPAAPPSPRRIPLLSAGSGECRYPLWADNDPDFHVCGLPSGLETYCEHHARICGAPKTARQRKAA